MRQAINYEILKEKLELIPIIRDKIMFYALFGSAARIIELSKIRKRDIRLNGKWLLIDLWTAKHRQHPTRTIPINTDEENWLTNPILSYVERFKDEETRVFPYSTRWIEILCSRYFPFSPHTFRHSRLTWLKIEKNLDTLELQQIAGWTNTKPATIYIHIDYRNLLKKLV